MISQNITKHRCLILSNDRVLQSTLEKELLQIGYLVDVKSSRNEALHNYMQYRHYLILIDEYFLPRYPHRLFQLFKMSHKEPGIIIFKRTEKSLAGYNYFNDGPARMVTTPLKIDNLLFAIRQVEKYIRLQTQGCFLKDLLYQVGMAVPVMIFLTYLLTINK